MAYGVGNNTAPMRTGGLRSSNNWNLLQNAKGFLTEQFKNEIPYTQIFSGFINASQRISTFDFNASDERLNQLLESHNQIMAGALGALVGRSIGSALAIGGAGMAGMTVPKISSTALAKRLMEAGTEEAKDEIIGEIRSLLGITQSLLGNRIVIVGYMKFRSLLKATPRALLMPFFDEQTIDFIKYTWGEEGSPPLILSEEIENQIESIDNSLVRTFVEDAVDEGVDAFIETGFVIAQELDTALAEFQLRQSQSQQIIEIETIANEPNAERIIIQGNDPQTIEQNAQTAITNWRLLQSRDIGQIITQDLEILEVHPQLRRLEITFKSVPYRPFINPDGSPAKTSVLSIPNLKSNLTWEKIRRTVRRFNNSPAYYWGDNHGILRFTDKRKISINYDKNSMSNEAIEGFLKDIADLSMGFVKTIRCSEVVQQPTGLRDNAIGMYAFSAKLVNFNLTNINQSNANRSPRNYYEFPLWTDDEPDNFTLLFNAQPSL